MSDWRDWGRRSGRTTLMLARAIEWAREGKRVLVLVANHRECDRIERDLADMRAPKGITVETPRRVRTVIAGRRFDRLAVDHFAFEHDVIGTLDACAWLHNRGIRE